MFLRGYAAEPNVGAATGQSAASSPCPDTDAPPSRRKMAELLGIPRDRLPALHTTLGKLLTDCRASSLAGRPQERDHET